MRYTLMHKEIPVLDMDLDEATSSVQKIAAVYQPRHLPLGTGTKKDGVDRAALNAWWIDRSIPASRSGVRRALETLDLPNTQMLLTRCFGLSLSDPYGVRPEYSGLEWKQINFFEDPFAENVGDVLLGKAADAAIFDSGSSLGYDKLPPQILSPRMTECKPFKRTHDEQIKLVRSFAWIDFDQLDGIEQDLRRIFDQAGDYMDENRKSAILAAFSARSDNLKALAKTQHPIDDQTQDVEQDVAEDYVN